MFVEPLDTSTSLRSEAALPKVLTLEPRIISIMSETTAFAVGIRPAPGPWSMIGFEPMVSMTTMLVPPSRPPRGEWSGTKQGVTLCSRPNSVICAVASNLIR